MPANPHSPKQSAILWREVPMFRFSMAFIPGMIVALLTGIPMAVWLAAFLFTMAICAASLFYGIRDFRAVIALLVCFLLGGLLASSQQILCSTQAMTATCGDSNRGIISDIDANTSGNKATLLLLPSLPIDQRRTADRPFTLLLKSVMPSYRVLVYFSKCGDEITVGDTIAFSKPLHKIDPPQSDFEFNASRYYASLGVNHRVFLKPGDYERAKLQGFSLSKSSSEFRKIISNKIKQRLPDRGAAAILMAMLIGDKSNIDSQLKTSYSKSGSIHILAISGLHIGIVASILIGLLGLPAPQRSRSLAAIKAFSVLAGIWAFTWISGMSPSATRAAFMFTIYLFGILFMRKAHILNILGFTAMLLLVHSPFLIFNLGFQFSFLALSGIVIWGIPLLRVFAFKHRILQYGWGIIAVSLGAQIMVAPAILYYFSEISLISPLTSLIAIPAAYIAVCGGIAMLVAELISPAIGSFIGEILSYCINLMNQIFTDFSELSWSTVGNVYISAGEVAILACIILLLSLRILTTQKICVVLALPFSLLFAIVHCQTYIQRTAGTHLTIYASKSEFAFDLMSTGSTYTTIISTGTNDFTEQLAQRNRLQHYANEVSQITTMSEFAESSLLEFKIFVEHEEPFYVMYIGSDPEQLPISGTQTRYVILSNVLDYRVARQFNVKHKSQHLVIHDMRRQGAFNLSIT